MKERPILFNSEMVRAILDGRKTQTRRVVKPQPMSWSKDTSILEWRKKNGITLHSPPKGLIAECPYGDLGDRLWVRETFYIDHMDYIDTPLSGKEPPEDDCIYYRSDGECCDQISECCCSEVGKVKWRPSIFMPRWASRINREIVNIRIERVQDITTKDALAEGIKHSTLNDPRVEFQWLWDSINALPKPVYCRDEKGKKIISHYISYPWEDVAKERTHNGKPWYVYGNPWVFVVEVKRII